jgi:hypothetical protein
LIRPEGCDVQSAPEVPAKDERLLGPGRRGDYIRTVERIVEITSQNDIETLTRRISGKSFGGV